MISYLQEAENWNKQKEKIYQVLNDSNIPMVLFGQTTAVNGEFLYKIHVEKRYIFDNDKTKWGNEQWGLKIISPNECPYQKYNVLILVPFVEEIKEQLKQLPNPPQEIFYLDLYFESDRSALYYQNHSQEIKEILNILSDELSKQVFEKVIQYRVNRNPEILHNLVLPRKTQYFPKELGEKQVITMDEIFVDAGAFIGDTVSLFKQFVNGKYKSIYAFEPDSKNYQILCNEYLNDLNIHCYNAGVGGKSQKLNFVSDTSSSKFSEEGGQTVQILSLDETLLDIPVTYLKMDVEGMECEALKGAERLIKKYKPKLAICTYHSDEDMLQVPKKILELNPDYHLYFRHYTTGIVETVCYAI